MTAMWRRAMVLAAVLCVAGGGAAALLVARSHGGTATTAASPASPASPAPAVPATAPPGAATAQPTTAAGAAGAVSTPLVPGSSLLLTRAGGGLALVDPGGGPVRPLHIPGAYGTQQGRGVWSPDGRRIAFQANSTDAAHVEVADADGGHVQDLTPTGPHVLNLAPAWSPDGTRILFASTRASANPAIWVVSLGDRTAHQLSNGAAHDAYPTWSPDGKRVAFLRTVGSSAQTQTAAIVVMNADGSRQQPIAKLTETAVGTLISWSPDGTRLAFVDGPVNQMQVWTIHPDGTGVTRITSDGTGHFDPAWSPDGRQIAFARFTAPNPGIYVMNADGSSVRRITDATTGPLPDASGRLDGQPQWLP